MLSARSSESVSTNAMEVDGTTKEHENIIYGEISISHPQSASRANVASERPALLSRLHFDPFASDTSAFATLLSESAMDITSDSSYPFSEYACEDNSLFHLDINDAQLTSSDSSQQEVCTLTSPVDHTLPTVPQWSELYRRERPSRRDSSTSAISGQMSGLKLSSLIIDTRHTTITRSGTSDTATTASPFPVSVGNPAALTSMTSVYFPPSASALHQKRRKAKKYALRVPRPRNCFMLYRSKVRPMIMVELGKINNKEISKIAADRWRNETESVKAWYRTMAKQGKDEHAKHNPGYKYTPNKKLMVAATAVTATATISLYGIDPLKSEDGYGDMDAEYASDIELTLKRRSRRHGQSTSQSNTCTNRSTKRVKLTDHILRSKKTQESSGWYHGRRPSAKVNGAQCGEIKSAHSRSNRSEGQAFHHTHVFSDHRMSATDGPLAPMPLSELDCASGAMSMACYSPIDQHLYLAIQQHENMQSVQRHQQQHPQQQQQQQRQQLRSTQSFTPGSVTLDHSSTDSSLYNLSADANASSATLVDQINTWMTHRYTDPNAVIEHLRLTAPDTICAEGGQALMGKATHLCGCVDAPPTSASNNNGNDDTKRVGHLCAADKELPSLPLEATKNYDTNVVLSRLYDQYNSSSVWPPIPLQGFPVQFFTVKGPEAISMTTTVMEGGRGECTELWQQHAQQVRLPQQEQHCPQQEYLIRPVHPNGFMSFAEAGQESLSTIGIFSWPSEGAGVGADSLQ
ncbi:hypothetical protein BGZ99_008633 [Dissophora globulifera]|uniref:HMG box domain-containing protein n=1 Tax=Dissophora globulifera TaxID=979702 RepID=A0A9P6UYY3_9FUNG|nr:hypothetical protein BGZ99_008633 [Dissophora globulifera]